jgi:hypothetical protein
MPLLARLDFDGDVPFITLVHATEEECPVPPLEEGGASATVSAVSPIKVDVNASRGDLSIYTSNGGRWRRAAWREGRGARRSRQDCCRCGQKEEAIIAEGHA